MTDCGDAYNDATWDETDTRCCLAGPGRAVALNPLNPESCCAKEGKSERTTCLCVVATNETRQLPAPHAWEARQGCFQHFISICSPPLRGENVPRRDVWHTPGLSRIGVSAHAGLLSWPGPAYAPNPLNLRYVHTRAHTHTHQTKHRTQRPTLQQARGGSETTKRRAQGAAVAYILHLKRISHVLK